MRIGVDDGARGGGTAAVVLHLREFARDRTRSLSYCSRSSAYSYWATAPSAIAATARFVRRPRRAAAAPKLMSASSAAR